MTDDKERADRAVASAAEALRNAQAAFIGALVVGFVVGLAVGFLVGFGVAG